MIAIILLVLTCDIGDGVDRRTTIGHCLAVALSHQTVTLALGLLSKSQHLGDMTTIISAAANIPQRYFTVFPYTVDSTT
ncbi:hypothetical protein CKK34_3593 [Yarrowia sp. E02]|nr:hypothetical protein CKK34_3593 [Yarrowia sp. E02]